MPAWTASADIRAKVRRRWDDGAILRALAAGSPFPVVEVPPRGPRPAEIGDDLDAVRAWISELESGARAGGRYELQYASIGGRLIGRNTVPTRALVRSFEQASSLLGVQSCVRDYSAVLDMVAGEPDVRGWVGLHPLRSLDVADSWPTLLAAYRWLSEERGSQCYLRQITAPGVDTKFVERNRPVLAALLGVPSTATGFTTGLGLRAKPDLLEASYRPGHRRDPGAD